VVEQLATLRPDLRVVGGMASAARGPGGNRLVLDGAVHHDGAVGVLLDPAVPVRTVVSQGCRPVGTPMIATKAERNLVYELAGRPALDRLMEVVDQLDPDDRALAQKGLHAGLVIDERKAEFERGDFLVRNVLGADRANGAIAVGAEVEVGATVQLQVRDALSADEDLRALLADVGPTPSGALVFTCTGRGTHLFGEPHHDATVVDDAFGGVPTAGMFCAGEIGPVGGRTFVHGFTASLVLFGEDDG
jgi:small ligand-binding sensory domain FIST